jgi:predicted transcriptional regulator
MKPVERALLLMLLDPPSYGGSIEDLAARLGESEQETRAAARVLADHGIARLEHDCVSASGPMLDYDALCPIAI